MKKWRLFLTKRQKIGGNEKGTVSQKGARSSFLGSDQANFEEAISILEKLLAEYAKSDSAAEAVTGPHRP
jgi:hypothetical protein